MENLITWLENQIEGCDDLGDMGKEKWAFIQTLKKVRKEQLILTDAEVKAHIDTLPYYGTCTTEYNEGFEDGVKWLKEQL